MPHFGRYLHGVALKKQFWIIAFVFVFVFFYEEEKGGKNFRKQKQKTKKKNNEGKKEACTSLKTVFGKSTVRIPKSLFTLQ